MEYYKRQKLDSASIDIMLQSLAENTYKQYNSALNKWRLFCEGNDLEFLNPETNVIVKFLTEEFHKGAQYGSLNSMRAALSLLCNKDLGNDFVLNKLFKGFFRLRPPKPRYTNTWDVDIVLKELEKWVPLESLSLEKLTWKLVMLLMLCTGFRLQNVVLIKLEGIKINSASVEIMISDIIKTSRPGAN